MTSRKDGIQGGMTAESWSDSVDEFAVDAGERKLHPPRNCKRQLLKIASGRPAAIALYSATRSPVPAPPTSLRSCPLISVRIPASTGSASAKRPLVTENLLKRMGLTLCVMSCRHNIFPKSHWTRRQK
jgi:hypothetical protein